MSRLRAAAGVLSLVGTVAHEGTHYAAARAVTDDAKWSVEVTGARAKAGWPPMESRLLRVVTNLAPTLLGVLLLGVWIYIDPQLSGLLLIPKTIVELSIGIIAMPSVEDVKGALGRQDAQQET